MSKKTTKWSNEQIMAIETIDKNVLVSAAAGSGKTAVLVERIVKLVIEKKVPIDKMLVVTYTNAAAKEMKERLQKEILRLISEDPNRDDIKELKLQLSKIGTSNISTIHAFALNVIRQYYYMVDVDSSFKMGDETVCNLLKIECMDQVFRGFYENIEENEITPFQRFIQSYSNIKNDDVVKDGLIKFYETLQSLTNPFDFLENSVTIYNMDKESFGKSKFMDYIMSKAVTSMEKAEDYIKKSMNLVDINIMPIAYDKLLLDLREVETVRECAQKGDFDSTKIAIDNLKFAVMRSVAQEKESYEIIKEDVNSIRDIYKKIINTTKENYFAHSLETVIENQNKAGEAMSVICEIIKEFHVAYSEIKKEKNIIDFSDMEHFALEILKDEEVQKEYQKKFDYIFVDEYQDTNEVQEKLISCVERGNNTFRVGDIKQCIYGFRMSDPSIFREKYEKYRDGEKDSIKIDLNQNFRSKGTIIEGVNDIFELIMENYDEDARLKQGLPKDENYEHPIELHYYDSTTEEEKETDGNETELDEEIEEMTKGEKESLIITKVIKENLGKVIYDNKKGEERPITYKDMVILYRGGKTTLEVMKKVLKDNNIEAFAEDKEGYFETLEIATIVDLLKTIDNRKEDLSLLAILRSPIFDFSTNQLSKIRIHKPKGYFYDGVLDYSNTGSDEILVKKCKNFLEKIKAWKKKCRNTPVSIFAWDLMIETGLYEYSGAMRGGAKRQANLRAFVDKANIFMETGDGTIYGFLKYIDQIKSKKIDIGQANMLKEGDDVVRIMTIHKSKGLEFPLVILPFLGKNLKKKNSRSLIEMSKDIGAGIEMKSFDEMIKTDTMIHKLVKESNAKRELAEEMRVLYVAFTRARDKLILIGTLKNKEKIDNLIDCGITSENSFLEILYGNKGNTKFNVFAHNENTLSSIIQNTKEDEKEMNNIFSNLGDKTDVYAEIDRRLSYQYENSEAQMMKSKTSVSKINRNTIEEINIQSPEKLGEKLENIGMVVGTVNHAFLEHIDFQKGREEGEKYMEQLLNSLCEKNIIHESRKKYVDLDKIKKLISDPVFERLVKSQKVEREKEFTLVYDNNNENVLVQGVIDLFFVENNKIILIDYKTNRNIDKIEEEYKTQLEIYKKAIETNYNMEVSETYLALIGKGELRKI